VKGGKQGPRSNGFPVELVANTSFVGCAFEGTKTVRYIYLPQIDDSMVRLENCTFELDGLEPGLQAVVLRNSRNGQEETTEGVSDRVFSDVPVEVGVQDITIGYQDTYYDSDIEDLTIVVGPNLEDASGKDFLSGDDEALIAYKSQLVRYLISGIGHSCVARYRFLVKNFFHISFVVHVDNRVVLRS
jgi:hypothetical protein